MNQFLGILQALLPWFLIALAVFLLWKFAGGLFTSLGAGLGSALSGTVPAIAIVAVAIVALFAVIVIWQPTFFNSVFGVSGPFGPSRLVAETKADLTLAILEPAEDARQWKSEAAKAAADNLTSEYQLATAKNKAGISAAEADRLSHLPKGHPDRKLWDDAGMDPADGSLSPIAQVARKDVASVVGNITDAAGKIDVVETQKSLSQPFGSPPKEAEDWVKPFYNLPGGVVGFVMLLLAVVVLGWFFNALLRSFRRI